MKSWFTKKDRLLAGTIIAGAAVLGMTAQAHAQDVVAEEEEAIVVTGSRIARANLTSPTAVTTVDAQAIELSGEDNIADILRGVPSFGASAISSGNSNFFTVGNGINTLQLRNLGEARTLVMVNGRRYVSGVPGAAAVDFNTIPTDLLERVEVITGGASAIYGADALAGVINLILRDDFEGIEYRYQYGESGHGDDVNHRFSMLAGGNFADGRGNAVLNVAFTQNGGVYARDRDNTAVDDIALCVTTPGAPDPENCQTAVEGFFSSFSELGRFFDYSTAGESLTCASGTGSGCVVAPFSTALHGFNRQSQRRYTVPIERFMLAGNVNYEISPSIEAFAETMFSHTNVTSDLEPFPHSSSDLSIVGIPCTNPFIPSAMVTALCDGGDTAIPYTRRMTEIGNRGNIVNRNVYRVLLGLRGDFAERYNWETYYSFGRTEDAQRTGGQINVANMREALNIIDTGGVGDPADFVCANPTAVAEGCVPINLFGRGSITEEAAAWVQAPMQRQGMAQQEFAGATLSGPMFELPAGDAEFAFGVEWRRERAEDIPDALTQTGQNASNVALPTIGSYSVGEVFAETEFPIIREQPFFHDLTVGLAYRWSDYSSAGETEAYTGRLQWAPTEWLRFRAQYARAVRVPNIGELFAPAGENFAPVSDPCNGVTAATTGDVAANCRADPSIMARILATGSFTLTQSEIQGTGGFTGGGNEDLAPEVADSFNVGFVANHNFGAPGNMTLSVDWYQIEVEGIIRALGRQETIALCYAEPAGTFPNDFCDNIVRDDTGPNFQLGEITEVNTATFNDSNPQEFSGVDVAWLWNFSLSDWFGAAPGDISLRVNWTHLLYETEDGDGDTVGQMGSSQDKIQAGVMYNVGPWGVSWETNYLSDSVPSLVSGGQFNFSLGEYLTHDVRVNWDVNESTNLYFGSNNVFDEDAPLVLSGVPGNTTGTDTNASIFDPIGRTFYAGIRLRY